MGSGANRGAKDEFERLFARVRECPLCGKALWRQDAGPRHSWLRLRWHIAVHDLVGTIRDEEVIEPLAVLQVPFRAEDVGALLECVDEFLLTLEDVGPDETAVGIGLSLVRIKGDYHSPRAN